MSEIAAMAERLRIVKRSYQHFLALWAVERLMTMPLAIERFHADIEHAMEDPHNHDWKILYRGSVLDD
jgi:hypothetical protein